MNRTVANLSDKEPTASPSLDARLGSGATELTPEIRDAAIAAARDGNGTTLQEGGEASLVRVGNLVVKNFYESPPSALGMTYAQQLAFVAAELRCNEFNVIVQPLPCIQDGACVVSVFYDAPNLADLCRLAAAREADAPLALESDDRGGIAAAAFLAAHPKLSCADLIRQINDLLGRMRGLDQAYVPCSARSNHFLVLDVQPPCRTDDFQRVVLLLIDLK